MAKFDKIAVIGLGYVGLPLALALAGKFENVVGFDVNEDKVASLRSGVDVSGAVENDALTATRLQITACEEDMRAAKVYIVAVPTPVDSAHIPDLTPVIRASETVGRVMGRGAVVCYESTVYPGVTEEICAPILAKVSGLRRGVDFKMGYSPERINPGDAKNRLETIVKVISGEDPETADLLKEMYGAVVEAGIHAAPSIKVAEAAKVIENTQRDLNIALMNELAIIFDLMGISTEDVLEAARTKWNFLPFSPGLVGGHCIGVDPYYLTYKSEELGYIPQVILAGRRINDGMGKYIAQKTIKLLCRNGGQISESRVGILGLTFKENVSDLRNSKIPNIVRELEDFGVKVMVHDPLGDTKEAMKAYGIELCRREKFSSLDAIILAVAHEQYKLEGIEPILGSLRGKKGVFVDVKSVFRSHEYPEGIVYWSL
ncbi:MAG: nucleotide sugar dehydrogenase [Synergistaceae bacterium]|nr:nucleotide sugar dehydrogenase [Synergistaceae bacterium]